MTIERVKYKLNHKVFYKNIEFIFSGCTIRYNDKKQKYFYQAELQDVKARSVVICSLDDVEETNK